MERSDIGTLLIPNIRPSDAGTFLCVGTNAIGSSEARIEVTVVRGERRLSELCSSVELCQNVELCCVSQDQSRLVTIANCLEY